MIRVFYIYIFIMVLRKFVEVDIIEDCMGVVNLFCFRKDMIVVDNVLFD